MKVTATKLKEVLLIEPKIFNDGRGFFFESFQAQRYQEHGIKEIFVQDNVSRSARGTLRGLHYQLPNAQGKLVYVISGCVLDVAVDIRCGSPTFGQSVTVELSEQNHRQLYVPTGFAHGFCVVSETADFIYKCTEYYTPAVEYGIAWNDPDLKIEWPFAVPLLSEKDKTHPCLREVSEKKLFQYNEN